MEHLAVTIDVWPLLVERFLIDDNGHTVDLVHYLRLISGSGHSFDFHGMNWVGSYKNYWIVISFGLVEQTHVCNHVFHSVNSRLGWNYSCLINFIKSSKTCPNII